MSLVALPFVVIARLDASIFQVAALGIANAVPWVIYVGLRTTMLIGTGGRALAGLILRGVSRQVDPTAR